MLALLDGGGAEKASPGSTTWSTLASPAALAATLVGLALRAEALTAATFTRQIDETGQ